MKEENIINQSQSRAMRKKRKEEYTRAVNENGWFRVSAQLEGLVEHRGEKEKNKNKQKIKWKIRNRRKKSVGNEKKKEEIRR